MEKYKKYSRPVYYETNNNNQLYYKWDTCLGIKYSDNYFLITAKHIINHENENNKLSIPYKDYSKEFLPYKNIFYPENKIESDDDIGKYDFGVIFISKESLNLNEFDETTFLDITKIEIRETNFQEAKIFAYPKEINNVDNEKQKIQQQRIELNIFNIQKSDYDYQYSYQTINENKKYLDGISGSPIYEIENNNVYLRGLVRTNRYFISFSLIKLFLEKILTSNS